MRKVRCALCRHHLPTVKKLKNHYLTCHSKIQIIRQLLTKNYNFLNTPIRHKKRRFITKYKTIYFQDKVHISYKNNTILIQDFDGKGGENSLEFTFTGNNFPSNDLEIVIANTNQEKNAKLLLENGENCGKSKKRHNDKKTQRNLLHIGIKHIVNNNKSLSEQTGEFYECHCMDKNNSKIASSDTESCSDTGTKTFHYCNFCGNGYQSAFELTQHEIQFCKIRNGYKMRTFVCHLCGFEFFSKEILINHLECHFEQQTFEDVLNMERDYNLYGFYNTNFAAGDYYSNINNILLFLSYPYDHYYSRNMFMKVVCDICCQEFYIYDYERHLKGVHFLQ